MENESDQTTRADIEAARGLIAEADILSFIALVEEHPDSKRMLDAWLLCIMASDHAEDERRYHAPLFDALYLAYGWGYQRGQEVLHTRAQYGILNLFGHSRVWGRLSRVKIADVWFLHVDGRAYHPNAVFSMAVFETEEDMHEELERIGAIPRREYPVRQPSFSLVATDDELPSYTGYDETPALPGVQGGTEESPF